MTKHIYNLYSERQYTVPIDNYKESACELE